MKNVVDRFYLKLFGKWGKVVNMKKINENLAAFINYYIAKIPLTSVGQLQDLMKMLISF